MFDKQKKKNYIIFFFLNHIPVKVERMFHRAIVVASSNRRNVNGRFLFTTLKNRHHHHHHNHQHHDQQSKSSFDFFNIAAATSSLALFGIVKCAESSPVTSEEFEEKASGFRFPRRLSDGSQLISATVRKLSYVFQTYVVAFYVDALPRVSGVSLESFEVFERESQARVFKDLLCNHTSNLKLELRPSRDTIGNHLISAWRPKLQDRLTGSASTPLDPADAALLDKLAEALNPRRFPYRSALVFEWNKHSHTLKISHDGAPIATIDNADRVSRALVAMYIDEKSTTTDIKRDFGRGVFELLKAQQQQQR
jgi:hypothetical protein